GHPRRSVLLTMIDILLDYVHHGARAIRLDAIAYVWKELSSTSINLAETHMIVAMFRACLDAVAPDVVLVTETNVPHEENITYFGGVAEPEADAIYQFALAPLVLHTMITGSTTALRDWARTLMFPPSGKTYLNVLASHDGIGLRPAERLLSADEIDQLVATVEAAGGVVNRRSIGSAQPQPYELAIAWFAAMAHGHDEDAAIARHLAAHAIALALRGVPLLYFNSLFGIGNDETTFAATSHGRDLNRGRSGVARLTAELDDPLSRSARVWTGLHALLRRRSGSAAFHPAAEQHILDSPDGTLLIERRGADGVVAVVAINVTAGDQLVDLPPGTWRADDSDAHDVIGAAGDTVDGWDHPVLDTAIHLRPWSASWLRGETGRLRSPQ
ncbi:MAG: hypothetical protein ABIW84_07950, partial [Ilumatobacteraceae bacterium]